ncbi:hypothetical protein E7681_07205 [Thalassobius vesicularis]|uniref:Uncharacterized protein n=1 Tax=Thalassobius vesicularis TaxID=1294297 RepID=A0A4S3M9K1_9RHOB|nr:hypothetical protein [Thalassobius vesicularis]THD74748.1 hypothetical protein E7681_07205 [Thalassobius vesicularis]
MTGTPGEQRVIQLVNVTASHPVGMFVDILDFPNKPAALAEFLQSQHELAAMQQIKRLTNLSIGGYFIKPCHKMR